MQRSAREWVHVRVEAPTPSGARPGLVTSARNVSISGPLKYMLTVCLDDGGMTYAFSDMVHVMDEPPRLPHWSHHILSEYCRAKHENGEYSWWAVCSCGYQTPKFQTKEGAKELYEAHTLAIYESRKAKPRDYNPRGNRKRRY